MIRVYRINRNEDWKLRTTFDDSEAKQAKEYADSQARITKDTHIVVYPEAFKPSDTFRGENDPAPIE